MTSKTLTEVLLTLAAGVRDGDEIKIGRDTAATLFVALGNETLTIDRITAVECKADVLIASTQRNERFVLAYEDVRALRIAGVAAKASFIA